MKEILLEVYLMNYHNQYPCTGTGLYIDDVRWREEGWYRPIYSLSLNTLYLYYQHKKKTYFILKTVTHFLLFYNFSVFLH